LGGKEWASFRERGKNHLKKSTEVRLKVLAVLETISAQVTLQKGGRLMSEVEESDYDK